MNHPNLAAALAAVQAEMPSLAKGNTAKVPTKAGGSYSYSYADLADVTAVILPLLGRHGLSFSCRPTLDDGRFVLAYSLMHEGGDRLDGTYPIGQGSPQEIGSGITYARRYALCAVTGLAPGGDDDDGVLAPPPQHEPRPLRVPADGPTPITEQQGKALYALLKATGRDAKPAALGYLSGKLRREVDDIRDLSKSEASRMIEALKVEAAGDGDPLHDQLRKAIIASGREGGEATTRWISDTIGRVIAGPADLTAPEIRKVIAALEAETADDTDGADPVGDPPLDPQEA